MKEEPKLDGFIVDEVCLECSEDELCVDCYEQKEARLVNLAYSKVEQNLVEQESADFYADDSQPPASEWVGSKTLTSTTSKKITAWSAAEQDYQNRCFIWKWGVEVESQDEPKVRREFLEPTNDLSDRLSGYRFLGQHIYDLRDDYDISISVRVPVGYAICQSCHFEYNKSLPCPNH